MTSDRADRLAEYLDEVGCNARFWEESNCLLFPALWASRVLGVDFSNWVGAIQNGFAAGRLLRRHGGIDRLASEEAKGLGLVQIAAADACLGDVGLIAVPRPYRAKPATLGCIRTASRWAIRTQSGITTVAAATIRVDPHLVWKL